MPSQLNLSELKRKFERVKPKQCIDGDKQNEMRLIRKAWAQLRYNYEDDRRLAQAFRNRRLKQRVLARFRRVTAKLKKMRVYTKTVKQIVKLFRMRLLL